MTAETIAKALGGHRAGATWMARCPAHDDSSPSLAISTGSNGKVLVRCHAGCDQRDVIAAVAPRYPGLRIAQAIELSYLQHFNWFPADERPRDLPPQRGMSNTKYHAWLVQQAQATGPVSFNHPFGATRGPLLTGAARTAAIAQVAANCLGHGLYGASYLEVGYAVRGHIDLDGHLTLWDILLAAGIAVYANGVSDNHNGTLSSWQRDGNRFVTDIIADAAAPSIAVPALTKGRAFVSSLGQYSGMLDLACGAAVMGGVAGASGSPTVTVTATDVPAGGKVRLLQYAVHGDRHVTTVRAPLTDVAWPGSGTRTVSVRGAASYVRAEVRDGRGKVVAFSNPLWLR